MTFKGFIWLKFGMTVQQYRKDLLDRGKTEREMKTKIRELNRDYNMEKQAMNAAYRYESTL